MFDIIMMYLHFNSHNDLPWQLLKRFNNSIEHFDFDKDVRDLWFDSSTDIPRLKKGLLGAQASMDRPP